MSNSGETAKFKGKLNWAIFLFFGTIVGGILYAVYFHGFLKHDRFINYRTTSGQLHVTPLISLVPARSEAGIGNGGEVYQRVCIACHGVYGQYKSGLLGPDLSDVEWLHHNNEKDIRKLIWNGITIEQSIGGQVMPARGNGSLNEREIWEVIYFLSSRNSSIEQDAEPTE